MKFVLEVDMVHDGWEGNAASELGRILRYWAGSLKSFEMKPGDTADIYDSEYKLVGNWRIVAGD